MVEPIKIRKIVSGGQTGADRAALDAAIEKGVPHGGWLPKGRKTEEGPLPQHYKLQEMSTPDYKVRTRQNVIDSDGTLIVSHGELTGGSLFTEKIAIKEVRPCLHIDLEIRTLKEAVKSVGGWARENKIQVLNVAGPRGSGDPLIYDKVKRLLLQILNASSFDNS